MIHATQRHPKAIDPRKFRTPRTILLRLLLASLCCAALSALVRAQANPPADNPAAILRRAWNAMGGAYAAGKIIHYHASAALEQNYESDRTYPPFIAFMQSKEAWFDPQTGVERLSVQTSFPLSKPQTNVLLTAADSAFLLRDNDSQLLPRSSMLSRYLNPWMVLADWLHADDVRISGTAVYRDYPRTVLVRQTPEGEQRLFLDPKTAFPVKLDFVEKHYLWGQRRIEYVYTNWVSTSGVALPASSFRLADGAVETSQELGDADLLPVATAPSLSLPDDKARSEESLPRFLQPLPLQETQVGPDTYLLSNPGYAEAVTKIGDEVFLLDATQGQDRAREDAEAIGRLFPGKHKITVVVTDLAWPHVAGVRYWVASGATIVAPKAAREFLQTVIDRRWTLSPDLLEQRRTSAKFHFIGVDATYSLAGGALTLHPIDGIASEMALMAYIKPLRFLWASDYIQTAAEPSEYASEVWAAVQRDHLDPQNTAAEHLPLTPWSKVSALQQRDPVQ